MLRQGIWMAIILSISALTACAHNEITGRREALEPKSSIVEHQKVLEPKSGITGRWEALEPKSGLVNMLEIQPDGKMKSSTLARVYAHYHIEGNKIILVPDNAPAKSNSSEAQSETNQDEQSKANDAGKEPVVYTFVLEKNRLKMTHEASGEVMDMQREGQATAQDSIVGNWSYKHPMGTTARMIFDASGINVVRVPLPGGMDVDYQLKGDSITATDVDKKHTQTVSYKLEDGKLALIDGKKTVYYGRLSDPK